MKNCRIKMPSKANLRARTSSISNAFVQSITPYIKPTDDEVKNMLVELEIEENQCAYCMAKVKQVQMDHLHPLVHNKMPSGHITHISNLVPSCGSCNGSKGNKEFLEWYDDEKTIEYLHQAGLTDEQIHHRRELIVNYSKHSICYGEGYKDILTPEEIQEYKTRRDTINSMLQEEHKWCEQIKEKLEAKIIDKNSI